MDLTPISSIFLQKMCIFKKFEKHRNEKDFSYAGF